MSLSAEVTTLPSLSGRFNLYLPRLKLSSRGGRVLLDVVVVVVAAAAAAAGALPVVEERASFSAYYLLGAALKRNRGRRSISIRLA